MTYQYDLVGNILKMTNLTPDCDISGTILGTDELDRLFKYDALYRLLEATGRESTNQPSSDVWMDIGQISVTNNANNCQAYKRKYQYDKMGRMTQMTQLGSNGFTRNYLYSTDNNQLDEVRNGSNVLQSSFGWDANGNMTTSNTERNYRYDQGDRMIAFYNKPSGSNATKYAAYFYDGSGGRGTKFIWTPGTGWECVTYIDGIFEYHHKHTSSTDDYKNYIPLQGGIEIRVGAYSDDNEPAIIYNFADHLNSVTFRIKSDGTIIDREEYYPYGESSMRTFEKKRYRYTGKEKDGESGLYYMGARYYAPWIVSFTTTDPAAGSTHYQSSYVYADGNPIMMNDPTGMASEGGGEAQAATENTDIPTAAEEACLFENGSNPLGEGGVAIVKPRATLAEPSNKGISLTPNFNEGGGPSYVAPNGDVVLASDHLSNRYDNYDHYKGLAPIDRSGFVDYVGHIPEGIINGLVAAPTSLASAFVAGVTYGIPKEFGFDGNQTQINLPVAAYSYDNGFYKRDNSHLANDQISFEEGMPILGGTIDWITLGIAGAQFSWSRSLVTSTPKVSSTAVEQTLLNQVDRSESVLNHIFRDASGHVNPNTVSEQNKLLNLFEQVANNPNNLDNSIIKSSDAIKNGVQGYTEILNDGTQAWVQVRKGRIFNAGINLKP